MPAQTLAQIIDEVSRLTEAGDVPAYARAIIGRLRQARAHLDGMEESRAAIDIRTHAFERANELLERRVDRTVPMDVLDLARFLAPAWLDLEDPETTDEVTLIIGGELTTVPELVATAVRELERQLATKTTEVELLESQAPDTTIALWGTTFGKMRAAEAEVLIEAFQAEILKRAAIADVASRKVAELERRLALAEDADVDTGIAATIRKLESDFADEHSENAELRQLLDEAELTIVNLRQHLGELELELKAKP